MSDKKTGTVYIVSAPSGSGKTTIINAVLDKRPDIYFSVSATTRKPRPGEVDGREYSFITKKEFKRMIDAGEFIEYANYAGNYYGSPLLPIKHSIENGIDVLLDIEIQGFRQIKEKLPEAVSIFIMPPSLEELERRLRGRGTDSDEKIAARLKVAAVEINEAVKYDHVVVNDTVERAVSEFLDIINGPNSLN